MLLRTAMFFTRSTMVGRYPPDVSDSALLGNLFQFDHPHLSALHVLCSQTLLRVAVCLRFCVGDIRGLLVISVRASSSGGAFWHDAAYRSLFDMVYFDELAWEPQT